MNAVKQGTTILEVSSHGIRSVNALNVFEVVVSADDEESERGSQVIDPGTYPQTLNLVTHGGLRQLKITADDGTDITAASAGTQYFISNPTVASVTPDGLVVGLDPGVATISVVYNGGQTDIPLRVQVPSVGPTVVAAAGGAI